MAVLSGLVSVFLVIALGVAARRWGLLGEAAAEGLNRLVANVALPALLLLKIGTSPLEASLSPRLMAVAVGALVVTAVLAFVVARSLGVPRTQHGVLAQAATWGNLAYVGFPVITAACGDRGLRLAAVTAAALIPAANLLSVAALEASRSDRRGAGALLVRVTVNPMVAASLLGLALAALHWRPWPWLGGILQILADFAFPGALLALGAQLTGRAWRGVWRPAVVAALLKLGAQPLVGWWVLRWLGAAPLELMVGVMLLAAPTAVTSYAVAAELGGDTDLAGACVLLTTLGALPTYVLVSLLLAG